MRHVVIMAGGSGTRLWPVSRAETPKQLIPFINGRSLLEESFNRFEGLIPVDRRYVCAARRHRDLIISSINGLDEDRFLGEPIGRDTLNAAGLSAVILARRDPEAIIGIFTADHIIEPADEFQKIIEKGFSLVEKSPETLVTFGITPTGPVTGYGYLELGESIGEDSSRLVQVFREKPSLDKAVEFFRQGPDRFLWNSGMFIWKARTLLECIRKYEPAVAKGLERIADAWDSDHRDAVLEKIFPTLKKTSVDYGIMEPASRDCCFRVAAIPMPLRWLDVGSWPSFAETRPRDLNGNAIGAEKHLLHETENCLVVSDDPSHLIATIGCRDLTVIHTGRATLVCHIDFAEKIKDVRQLVSEKFGDEYV